MTSLITQIEQMIADPLEKLGLDIVRIQLSGTKRRLLQVMIERRDLTALSIDLCTRASRTISALLDEADPIDGSYNLEVTSPGLDRPLMKPADYQRFIGEPVKIQVQNLIDNRRNFVGILHQADDHGCHISINDTDVDDQDRTQTVAILYDNIAQAKLEPDTNFNTLIKRKNKANKND